MIFNRRQLFQTAGLTLGVGAMPRALWAGSDPKPHYFLELVLSGGWDPTYLCDARPLAMTEAGLITNYLGGEQTLLTGRNGGQALVTTLFAPLRSYFDAGRLTILNGVHMAAGFDGHEQNLNFLFSGNPFGGNSFVPYLNQVDGPTPIDFLQVGYLFGTVLDNVGNGVSLLPFSAPGLTTAAQDRGPIDLGSPVQRFLSRRAAALGAGSGRVAQGVRQMAGGIVKAPDMNERLSQVDLDIPQGEDRLLSTMKLLDQYFKRGLTRNAVIQISDFNLDTHDAISAQEQVEEYPKAVAAIKLVLDFLSETPAGEGQALLDLTTVVVTSEFSRTMRQGGVPITESGTDHNPLNNTVLLIGKGVRGGQIVGASDQEAVGAVVSGAHRSLDQQNTKIMGRPFDFARGMPTTAMPEIYDPDHYLTFASVANTLMKLYGVPNEKLWVNKRDGAPAAVLGPEVISV